MDVNKKYSLWGNLKCSFRLLVKYEGYGFYAFGAINAVLGAVQPFLAVLLPSLAVTLLTDGRKAVSVIVTLLSYVIGLQLIQLLVAYSDVKVIKHTFMTRIKMDECQQHVLSMDYEKLESPEGQKKMEAARRAFHFGNSTGIEAFLKQVPALIKNVLGLAIYSFAAGSTNFLILIYMLCSTAFAAYMNWRASRWDYAHKDEKAHISEKNKYLLDESLDSKNLKDIKLYGMKKWLMDAFEDLTRAYGNINRRIRMKYFKAKAADRVLACVRDVIVYVYLIYEMINGRMEVDKFILMLGVIAGFGTWMNGIVEAARELWRNSVIMGEYREFMEYGVDENKDNLEKVPNPGCPHEIRLEHVSYTYPGAEKPSIKDVSLTIGRGEKLALVGINGAGKSTLVKLIAGLYHPTSGTITIDGVDISKLPRDEYYKELAVVFQEVFAFAFPLDSNITGQEEKLIDHERLESCLKQADIWEKVQSLPHVTHTMLMKDIDQNGVVLSGGEMQRLMLARALYKGAPVIILDEPTSALDPIAESNMYEKYYSLTKDKTSVFISHRLSSTRFCDRIVFMEGGEIVEEGSHDSLMRLNGRYAEMYNIQAHYYNEDGNINENVEGDVCYE